MESPVKKIKLQFEKLPYDCWFSIFTFIFDERVSLIKCYELLSCIFPKEERKQALSISLSVLKRKIFYNLTFTDTEKNFFKNRKFLKNFIKILILNKGDKETLKNLNLKEFESFVGPKVEKVAIFYEYFYKIFKDMRDEDNENINKSLKTLKLFSKVEKDTFVENAQVRYKNKEKIKPRFFQKSLNESLFNFLSKVEIKKLVLLNNQWQIFLEKGSFLYKKFDSVNSLVFEFYGQDKTSNLSKSLNNILQIFPKINNLKLFSRDRSQCTDLSKIPNERFSLIETLEYTVKSFTINTTYHQNFLINNLSSMSEKFTNLKKLTLGRIPSKIFFEKQNFRNILNSYYYNAQNKGNHIEISLILGNFSFSKKEDDFKNIINTSVFRQRGVKHLTLDIEPYCKAGFIKVLWNNLSYPEWNIFPELKKLKIILRNSDLKEYKVYQFKINELKTDKGQKNLQEILDYIDIENKKQRNKRQQEKAKKRQEDKESRERMREDQKRIYQQQLQQRTRQKQKKIGKKQEGFYWPFS